MGALGLVISTIGSVVLIFLISESSTDIFEVGGGGRIFHATYTDIFKFKLGIILLAVGFIFQFLQIVFSLGRAVFRVLFEPNQRTQKLLEKIQKDLEARKKTTEPLTYDKTVVYLGNL